jgi:hypothetical protein
MGLDDTRGGQAGTRGTVEQPQLGDPVCALVDGVDDVLEVIAQTVAAGLAAGDRVMGFTESVPPVGVPARLEGRDILSGRESRTELVQMLSARKAYLPAGAWFTDASTAALPARLALRTPAGVTGLPTVRLSRVTGTELTA